MSKSSRYALYAATEMAMADGPVTVAQVAEAYCVPRSALAKVFQQLVRVGIAHGVRGVGGGYVLARPASGITVLDVIRTHAPPQAGGFTLLDDGDDPSCDGAGALRIRRLFEEVEEVISGTFASVTLETLAR